MAMRCVCRLTAVVFVVAALCCGVALGSYSVNFSASDLTLSPRNGGDAVRLTDCCTIGVTWMPDLPVKGMSIAIPSNMDATGVRVVNVEYVDLPGTYTIAPCEPPVSTGATLAQLTSAKSASVVDFPRGIYPGELVRFGDCGWLSDHHLASVMVYPVQYDTFTGALRLYTHIEFELIMSPGGNDAPAIAVRSTVGEEAFASMARSLVINPSEVKPAVAQWGTVKAMPTDAEYLIITSSSLSSYFQPLADWKHAKGYTTQIKTVESIYSGYSGADNQAKIRACILDYKNNHGTVWVLLGGDINIIPKRMGYFFDFYGDQLAPTDVYYQDLQGTWDNNGNGRFGENDDGVSGGYPDMYPDVFLARAPVNNSTEISTFINKVLQYEGAPSKPALYTDYELKAVLLGGILDTDGPTDAADQMEYLSSSVIPSRFTKTKLYENNGTMTHTATVSNINAGRNIIVHGHHGNASLLSLAEGEDAYWEDVDAYVSTNAPRYTGLLTTWACISGGFDRDDGGRCVGESFLLAPSGGGFYTGNSREGAYYIGDPTYTLSPRVVTENIKSLFTSNKTRFGEMFGQTLTTIAPYTKDSGGGGGGAWERRCVGITILFGDPETPIWINTPAAMTITVNPTSIAAGTTTSVTVNVKKSGVNQSGAKVCLWKGTDVYLVGTTNTSGNATFSVTPTTSGTITVTATKLDLLPKQSSITVTGGGGGSTTTYAADVNYYTGTSYSGSYTDTQSDNSVYHRSRTATVSGSQVVELYYRSYTTITAPTTSLVFTFNGKVSSSGPVTFYMWNYTTGGWEQVAYYSTFSTYDTTKTISITSNPSRFVDPSNGQMTIDIKYTRSGTTARYLYIDLLKWVVTQ